MVVTRIAAAETSVRRLKPYRIRRAPAIPPIEFVVEQRATADPYGRRLDAVQQVVRTVVVVVVRVRAEGDLDQYGLSVRRDQAGCPVRIGDVGHLRHVPDGVRHLGDLVFQPRDRGSGHDGGDGVGRRLEPVEQVRGALRFAARDGGGVPYEGVRASSSLQRGMERT
ncbi:hypothetical protein GCM10023191_062380 [Actinoallomurus oryzae]|uniref:Uncharacterized protein n=1 Tax=Actinoallomurus oryzae TaxID=502180 RepID=A0ABP8QPY4_9ACTN